MKAKKTSDVMFTSTLQICPDVVFSWSQQIFTSNNNDQQNDHIHTKFSKDNPAENPDSCWKIMERWV